MLEYIEELFKSEPLIKNKNLLNALLYHADIYRDPKSSPEAKAKAMEQIKLIGSGKMPKEEVISKKPKVKTSAAAKPRVIKEAPASTSPKVGVDQTPAKPKITLKYHPLYQHYGVSKEAWDANPSLHEKTFEFHNEVAAGNAELAHVKNMIHQGMKKSLEHVLDNLKVIKEELDKSNYGPKGAGQYNPVDNIKRKASRTGDVAGAGPNTAVRSFSTKPGQLSAKQSAALAEKKKKKLSGPVKVFSPEEIKNLEAQRKLGKP